MIKIATIRKAEKSVFAATAIFITGYIFSWADLSSTRISSEDIGLTFSILSSIAPIIIFLGVSLFPYLIFYVTSNSIYSKSSSESYSRASFTVTAILMPLCCWAYYAAGKSIESDSSSTASLIFAVLPFYIAIIGGIFYGLIYLASRKGT